KLLRTFNSRELFKTSDFNANFMPKLFESSEEPFKQLINADQLSSVSDLLITRLNERNLVLISQLFSTIKLARLAQLLEIDIDRAENLLVDMIANDRIGGLINRMGEITIAFSNKNNEENGSFENGIE
ncbi:MAG: proteasome regulatory particle subunit, partial [Paramarteilia canceri]